MMRRIALSAAGGALLAAALVASLPDGHRWWSHVQYLADDKLEGRNTGSAGYRKAAAYVAGEFERAGLNLPARTATCKTSAFIRAALKNRNPA